MKNFASCSLHNFALLGYILQSFINLSRVPPEFTS